MRYYWIAKSNDGAYENKSDVTFDTRNECYYDMRNAALEKMKWNTEIEDFADVDLSVGDYIGYNVQFTPNKIIHSSYSGIYTYEVIEQDEYAEYVEGWGYEIAEDTTYKLCARRMVNILSIGIEELVGGTYQHMIYEFDILSLYDNNLFIATMLATDNFCGCEEIIYDWLRGGRENAIENFPFGIEELFHYALEFGKLVVKFD